MFFTCRQVPTICRNWYSSLLRVNHICASTSQISPCQIPTETLCGDVWLAPLWYLVYQDFDYFICWLARPVISFENKKSNYITDGSLNIQTPPEKACGLQKTYPKYQTSGGIWMSMGCLFKGLTYRFCKGNPHMEEKEVDDSDSSDEYYEQDMTGTRWLTPHIWDRSTLKHYLCELSPRGWRKHARLQDITQNILSTPGMIIYIYIYIYI